MPQTPNHEYNVPNEGEQDWHVPLNENFEQIDTDVETRGGDGGWFNFEPKKGAKFFHTGDGRVYVGDGSEWNRILSTGSQPWFEDVTLYNERHGQSSLYHHNPTDGATDAVERFVPDEETWKLLLLRNNELPYYAITAVRDGNQRVGIGTENPGVPLDVRGQNNWNLDNGDGDVRIGDSRYRLAFGVALGGGGVGACNIRAKGGIQRLNLGAGTNGHTVQIDPASVAVNGDLDVSGNKNFVQSVETEDGEREVVYTATESGTPHTEFSGVAELEDGRAEIDLPDHFGWVTSDEEPLVVQVTPHASKPVRPQVTERSTDRIVVEDFEPDAGDYEVSYTVTGTRAGHEDKQVVREPSGTPGGATDEPPSNGERHAEAD